MSNTDVNIPHGYCQCGCGQKTTLATVSHRARGWVRGEPLKYVHKHAHPNTRPKPKPEYKPISEFDFGWLIGMLEGEGCFSSEARTSKRTGEIKRRAQITVSSTDKSSVERLAALMPYCSVFQVRRKPPNNHAWIWSVHRADVATDLMIAVRLYMGPRRRERIDELLATCNTMPEVMAQP